MIIKITRSGGFAGGVEQLGTIDTSSLGAEAAAKVQARVAKLERPEAAARDQPIGADMFRYDIEPRSEAGGLARVAQQRKEFVHSAMAGAHDPMLLPRRSTYRVWTSAS